MNITFKISDIKPITQNHAVKPTTRGRFVSMYKTAKAKEFDKLLYGRLSQYQEEIDAFNVTYDPQKHYLRVDYRFYIPVLKKDGKAINQKSGDIDGYLKYTQDCIFKKLKADDSAICSLSASKIHSDSYQIIIDITICNIKHIQ